MLNDSVDGLTAAKTFQSKNNKRSSCVVFDVAILMFMRAETVHPLNTVMNVSVFS